MDRTANARAYDKLTEALSVRQRATLDEHKYFEVISNKGHVWRIDCRGRYMGNVQRVRTGMKYCGHINQRKVAGGVPVWDHYLAQALLLRTDERAFRRTAHLVPLWWLCAVWMLITVVMALSMLSMWLAS